MKREGDGRGGVIRLVDKEDRGKRGEVEHEYVDNGDDENNGTTTTTTGRTETLPKEDWVGPNIELNTTQTQRDSQNSLIFNILRC